MANPRSSTNGSAWRVALSRSQGRSHRVDGSPCQDQVFRAVYPDGTTVVALADGAGSARFSHYGADLVVRRAGTIVAGEFDRLFRATNNAASMRGRLVAALQADLSGLATRGVKVSKRDRDRLDLPNKADQPRISCSLRELSSTLLVVAIKNDRFIALHLGDGVIGMEVALKNRRRLVKVLSSPDNGEFANETQFVTSSNASDNIRMYRGRLAITSRSATGFILMSDGPEAALYHKPTHKLAPACAKLLQACRDLPQDEMQSQLTATLRDVIATRTHDDCALVLIAADHVVTHCDVPAPMALRSLDTTRSPTE